MTLTRTRHKMPDYIREVLTERKLIDAYHERPDYQQNDYIGWITRAKSEETKQKRLKQMLDELEGGTLQYVDKENKLSYYTSRLINHIVK